MKPSRSASGAEGVSTFAPDLVTRVTASPGTKPGEAPLSMPPSKVTAVSRGIVLIRPPTVTASWIHSAESPTPRYACCVVKDLWVVLFVSVMVHFGLPLVMVTVMESPGCTDTIDAGMGVSAAGRISHHAW